MKKTAVNFLSSKSQPRALKCVRNFKLETSKLHMLSQLARIRPVTIIERIFFIRPLGSFISERLPLSVNFGKGKASIGMSQWAVLFRWSASNALTNLFIKICHSLSYHSIALKCGDWSRRNDNREHIRQTGRDRKGKNGHEKEKNFRPWLLGQA